MGVPCKIASQVTGIRPLLNLELLEFRLIRGLGAGHKQNIISTALHLDESTPHMVVYAVPINANGRLAAKDFLGGREKLSQLQTDFHQLVGVPNGLERGVKGSSASHQTVKRFYSNISNLAEPPSVSKLDKLADVLGIKTQALLERDKTSMSLIAHERSFNKNALKAARSVSQAAQGSIDSLRFDQQKIRNEALAITADLARERIATAELRTALKLANEKLTQANEHSRVLYQCVQEFQALNRPIVTKDSNNQQKEHHDSTHSKPRLAI
jgi:transcriptional regulator with XRE-family HTH domain